MKPADIVLQHPKLHLVTDRLKGAINLAMEKVVAHEQNPQQYPLPGDPKSLERALHNFYSKLPNKKQKKMREKASVNMGKNAAQRTQIYGDLMAVNLKSSASIVEQVKAIPPPASFKLTDAEVTAFKRKIGTIAVKPKTPAKPATTAKTAKKVPGRTAAAPAAPAVATDLNFFIDSLTCIRKDEIGKDEINLAGVGIDSAGGTIELAPFFVGKFKKGDTIPIGKNPFSFKIDAIQFPATFAAGLFIIESDWIHNPDTIHALIIVFTAVSAALSAITLAMIIVGMAGGPASIPLIVAGLIGLVVSEGMTSFVIPLLADDISDATFDDLTFDQAPPPGVAINRTLDIKGLLVALSGTFNGKYQAAVHWETK